MPQLMPIFWINSLFMVVLVLVVVEFLYFAKKMEEMNKLSLDNEKLVNFNLLW